jgi:hypothetical protein
MQQYDDTQDYRHHVNDSLKELELVNKKLSKLLLRKEELTEEVISLFDHKHEGQKTYEFDTWKVEIRTPCTYSLDKKLYESGRFSLPAEYNPIKQSVSYTIDKRLCDDYITKAPKKVKDMLIELVKKAPGKPAVIVKARTQ